MRVRAEDTGAVMRCLFALLVAFGSLAAHAEVRVTDDAGRSVVLAAPAKRVVSLGPHLTELAYAASGGDTLVGVIRYSDFPEAAKKLPIVGDAHAIDFERIAQLKPDLVLVWGSGLNERHKARLRSLGLAVYENEIRQAQGIADTLRRLGTLLGRTDSAEAAARRFETQWQALAERYRGKTSSQPVCGGVNVFGDLPLLTPTVSWEAAIATDPQLIATSGRQQDATRDFAPWRRFANVSAVKHQRYVSIDGDLIGRMGPRFVDGVVDLCEAIDRAR
jgi:iron complex transport system substrate-binding protein